MTTTRDDDDNDDNDDNDDDDTTTTTIWNTNDRSQQLPNLLTLFDTFAIYQTPH